MINAFIRQPCLPAILVALSLGLVWGCGSKDQPETQPPPVGPIDKPDTSEDVNIPPVHFTEITDSAGIRFKHTNGSFGKKLLPETLGSGVAFLDCNRDGHQDLLFVNSCYWPGHEEKGKPPLMELYLNDGHGRFKLLPPEKSGLTTSFYGMGVTVGDYDNDGWPDVFITGVGGNHLFHNRGNSPEGEWLGFEEVTKDAGDLGKPGGWPKELKGDFLNWKEPINLSSSAAFLDFDGDGKLDLFVCNYVTWSPDLDLAQGFALKGGDRAYGPPRAFAGTQCFLYRNLGNGKFKDISAEAGIRVFEQLGIGDQGEPRAAGKSLGVIVCDPDNDGWPDIIVANDTARNFFFHNVDDHKGGRMFEEIGLRSGVAYADSGARGAMGIDWGEYRPGRSAVIIGNFANEPDTLLRLDNPQKLDFTDAALAEGLYGPSRSPLKFGAFFFDYDLDGRLDLLTCNGHLEPEINKIQPGQSYAQPAQLYWNCGGKASFALVGPRHAGLDLFRPMVGRGCAYADIDGDGYLDVVLTENGGRARLFHNDGGTKNNWIRLVLEGDGIRSNRSAIGARVTLEAGGQVQHREVASARGYLSQSELPVTFGLGQAKKIDRVTIEWPGRKGGKQILTETDLPINRVKIVRQGDTK